MGTTKPKVIANFTTRESALVVRLLPVTGPTGCRGRKTVSAPMRAVREAGTAKDIANSTMNGGGSGATLISRAAVKLNERALILGVRGITRLKGTATYITLASEGISP